MSNETQAEETFRGFKRSDFGFVPAEPIPFRDIDVENLNPEPGILAEYQELFGPDGYVERSMYVDALGGAMSGGTREGLMLAARRHMAGIKLPSIRDTGELMQKTYGGDRG